MDKGWGTPTADALDDKRSPLCADFEGKLDSGSSEALKPKEKVSPTSAYSNTPGLNASMTGVAERGELAEWMISGSMLRAGILVLFGMLLSNYYLFRPYFAAILLAWVVSVPLHALKDQIREFLTEGLLGRTREAAFHFVAYHLIYLSSRILVGKKLTGWGCEYLDSALYTAAVEPKGTLKLRPVEAQGPTGSEINAVRDPFRDLQGKPPTPTSPEEPPLTKQLCGKVDALLRRPDWFYIIVLIRCCVALRFLGALRDNHRPLLMTLALIGGASALISKSEPSLLTRFVKGARYLAEFCFQSLRLYLGEWIAQNTEAAAAMFLVFGVVFGLVWGGCALISSAMKEVQDGLLSYSGSLTRAGLRKLDLLLLKLAEGPAIEHLAPVHEYGDAFLREQLGSSLTLAEAARYLLSKEGLDRLISRAPITYHFIRDFINRKIATPSPLEMLKEVQALVQGVAPGASPWVFKLVRAVPLMPLATLASEGSFGFVVHMMLPNLLLVLDALYQMLLFTLTLWSLVSREASPLQPGRLLLSRVLGQEARLTNQLYELVCGVCLATFQMGLFHALFSWLTLRLFGAGGACLFALLSGLVAVVPIGGPYVAILPPVLFMWFIEGRRLIPAFLFICHVVVAVMVDGAFYAHLPSVSPFYTALAAFLGYSCLGLQGLFVGPFVLALVPHLYSEFLVPRGSYATPAR